MRVRGVDQPVGSQGRPTSRRARAAPTPRTSACTSLRRSGTCGSTSCASATSPRRSRQWRAPTRPGSASGDAAAALNDSIREGLIVVNPAALVRLPAGKRPKALVWTDERVQRWEAAVQRLEAADADDPAQERLEAGAQPPTR